MQSLRTNLPSQDANHTHLDKLESLVRADSERAMTVQQLKKELTTLQGELEGLRRKAGRGLAMVQQDGPTSLHGLGGREVQRDGPSSLQSRDPVAIRSSGQFTAESMFESTNLICRSQITTLGIVHSIIKC